MEIKEYFAHQRSNMINLLLIIFKVKWGGVLIDMKYSRYISVSDIFYGNWHCELEGHEGTFYLCHVMYSRYMKQMVLIFCNEGNTIV